jgi:hypothetical protein
MGNQKLLEKNREIQKFGKATKIFVRKTEEIGKDEAQVSS